MENTEKIKISYFPGCTLRTKAVELDRCARNAAEALGIELCEVDNWQCCGGVYISAKDEIASKLSSVRALVCARDRGTPLVSVCSACHNVIKQTEHEITGNREFADRVNAYMSQDTNPKEAYYGGVRVMHYLEMLRDIVGFDKIGAAVKNPLTGRKIAAYYGCMLLRPGNVMKLDDPENPRIMEDFIRAIGGDPIVYPMRNECCGGYTVLEDAGAAARRASAVTDSAEGHGADLIVTACPLCKYNLEKNGGNKIKTVYFTELLADALGVRENTDAAR